MHAAYCAALLQTTFVSSEGNFSLGNITYVTATTLGFAFLRNGGAQCPAHLTLPSKLWYVIIDEADQVLLDEARTDMIISSQSHDLWNEVTRSKIVAASAAAMGIAKAQIMVCL
jgi:preprotein translocase subunit SecA